MRVSFLLVFIYLLIISSLSLGAEPTRSKGPCVAEAYGGAFHEPALTDKVQVGGQRKNEKPDPAVRLAQAGRFWAGFRAKKIRRRNEARFGTPLSFMANGLNGSGLAVRTYYYPYYNPTDSDDTAVAWVGGVYALFVDPWGNLREDSNQNGRLDLASGFEARRGAPEGGDWIVVFRKVPLHELKDDFEGSLKADLYRDALGQNGRDESLTAQPLGELRTIWDAGQQLAEIPDTDVTRPRAFDDHRSGGRRIYLPGDPSSGFSSGRLKLSEKNLLSDDPSLARYLAPWLGLSGMAGQPDVKEARKIISYIMGQDQREMRSRNTVSPWSEYGEKITWRLGDIINSRPIIVGPAFSHYDFQFRDQSYARYKAKNAGRRLMAYFGANDGLLHAINLGFSLPPSEGTTGFSSTAGDGRVAHQLGKELWAYLPVSLLPRLQRLTRPVYNHSYFVDQRPTVVEIKDTARPVEEQWRTILIGGLGFGAQSLGYRAGNDLIVSAPEIFALDITDPEKEPEFLWSFSHPGLGMMIA